MTYSVSKNGTPTVHHSYVYLIENKSDRHGIFVLEYNELKHVTALEGRYTSLTGEEVSFSRQDCIDRPYTTHGQFATGSRLLIFEPEMSAPFTLQVTYELEYDGLFFTPDWLSNFEAGTHIESSTFTLEYPDDFPVRYNANPLAEDPDINLLKDKRISVKWKIEDFTLPDIVPFAETDQFYMVETSPGVIDFAGVRQRFESWSDLGNWYAKINLEFDDLNPRDKASILLAIPEGTQTRETIDNVFEYVKMNTRYVGIQIGEAGWVSMTNSQVHEDAYGDCKALTSFCQSLLKNYGIMSKQVLVRAGEGETHLDENFPTNRFNHVFLCVPNHSDSIWIECTSSFSPAGYRSNFTSSRKGLLVDGPHSHLVNIPASTYSDNCRRTTIHIDVQSAQETVLSEETRFFGSEAFDMNRMKDKSHEEKSEWIRDQHGFSKVVLLSESFDFSSDSVIGSLEFEGLVNNYSRKAGKRIIVPQNAGYVLGRNLEQDTARSESVHFRNSVSIEENLYFSFPEEFRLAKQPENVSLSFVGGSYTKEIVLSEGGLEVKKTFMLNRGVFDATEYDHYVKFMKDVKAAEGKSFMLVPEE